VPVSAAATICGTRIVVCVSKFGSFADVCADSPSAFLGTDEAREESALDLAGLASELRFSGGVTIASTRRIVEAMVEVDLERLQGEFGAGVHTLYLERLQQRSTTLRCL
jgi:hypothetical protein